MRSHFAQDDNSGVKGGTGLKGGANEPQRLEIKTLDYEDKA
jgi:hypothetical protein